VKMPTMLHMAIRISMIMMGAEILIMLILHTIADRMNVYEIALLDAAALVLLSTPPICFFVIRPFLETRAQVQARVRNMSLTDPLTQLPNRRLVVDHLDRVVAGCTRHNEYCAVLLINLDHFKQINEQYGYEAGDTVLAEVARRIHSTIRANDVVGRMGGDEFIVLLERLESNAGTTGESIMHIANKLIGVIDMPIAVKSKAVHVSASIGIRLLGIDPANTDTAITEADSAMYRAKEAGGGRAVIFE
jgi:two-component system cell cycle response regulator